MPYHTQVQRKLSHGSTKKTSKSGATVVTVRAKDAGDAMAGVKVDGLPGCTKATNAKAPGHDVPKGEGRHVLAHGDEAWLGGCEGGA